MSDNIDVSPGSGATIAADNVGGVLYQFVKVSYGADGTATIVEAANPLPVDQQSALPAGTNNIGDVGVSSIAVPGTVYSGQKTVAAAGTGEAISTTQAILSGVTLKALASNTDLVYVGPSNVTSSNGFELSAGDQIFVETNDLANVYVDAAVNAEGVSFVAS